MLGVTMAGPLGADVEATRVDAASQSPIPGRLETAERDAWAVLMSVDRLGPVGFTMLLQVFGSATAVLAEASLPGGVDRLTTFRGDVDPGRRRQLPRDVALAIVAAAQASATTLARIRALGLSVITSADDVYPSRLAAIEMPPPVLFVLGRPEALEASSTIAIVGTRRPTDAGRAIAARIATALVKVGTVTVSGLATGIDGAAHAATLHAGGTTLAVIGSGHATLFPAIHRRLAANIVDSGGAVVSELPPDVHATRGTIPRRNRVISGLADATVVVEAPARSGALITASWALEQGRECFLVPGSIDAPTSAGCLSFLREFADSVHIVAGIPQLIADLGLAGGLAPTGITGDAAASLVEVGATAKRIGQEVVLGRATVDELVAVTGFPVATVLASLTILERHGLVIGVHGRFRVTGLLAAAEPAPVAKASRARRNPA
jgi:DNA processing protein